MIMAFVAGQKVRASQLNSALPTLAYSASDVSVTNSTTLTNATGLVLSLDANALYAWDGYIGYDCNETADIKIAFLVPTSTTGHWGLYCVAASENTVNTKGMVEGFRLSGYGSGNVQGASGADDLSGTMMCMPHGYIATSTTAGSLQMQFAQNTSNGTASKIKAGSWLRLHRLA